MNADTRRWNPENLLLLSVCICVHPWFSTRSSPTEICVYHTLPLQFDAPEIEDKTNGVAGNLEVIEHLPEFVVGDALNDLRIQNNTAVRDQVRNIFTDLHCLVEDIIASLLLARNMTPAKLHNQRVFIRLFQEAMTEFVQYLKSAANDCLSFSPQNQTTFPSIR